MTANQPQWPRQWLMTDERLGERLWEALAALPNGAGVMFRHYGLSDDGRLALGTRIREVADRRGLVLAVAGSGALAEALGGALVHNPDEHSSLPFSRSVHDEREATAVRLSGAALAFVSPVHATRSHPGGGVLGAARAAKLAGACGCPVIAMGGMDSARFAELDAAYPGVFYGWAGIDAWLKQSGPSRE